MSLLKTMVALLLGTVASSGAVSAALSQTSPVPENGMKTLQRTPEYTADQILNADLPGRPPSPPPLPVFFDDKGFAKDRVFHLPAPGVHPRVLFGPQDLDGIRERLRSTASGRQMLAYTREQIAKGIDKPGTWENALYEDLLRGDLEAFGRRYKASEQPPVAGNSTFQGTQVPATKWHHRDSFGMALEIKAFICLLDSDSKEGARLGKAISAYASYFKPRIAKSAAGPYGDNFWRTMRVVVDGWPFLPLMYDLDFNYMTSAQQATTREVLSMMTKGKYTLGMELPAHWRDWNFIGLSLYECLFSVAIEGEDGYDPRVYKRCVEIVRDFLAYAINPTGMAHESVGYHSAGMTHTSFVMMAMAMRGDNFFTQSHYRAQLDRWYMETMQPYGAEWLSDGDLATFPPATEPLIVAKYFYPNDDKLDFVYQNTVEARTGNFAKDLHIVEAMIVANDPRRDSNGKLHDYHAGADFALPTTYSDNDRGVTITRSAWSSDATYLNFECHPDTTFASHDHADRGRFILAALGRNWSSHESRAHETREASSVLVDDVGQGFFPTYAKWIGVKETPLGTFAGCDATYAYNWKWRKEVGMWPADDPRLKTPFYAGERKDWPELDPAITEYDPSPQVAAYFRGYLAGDPRKWDDDSWVVRQPNNNILYAFRNAGLVRGSHPYTVIVDDMQKDALTHEYKWLMQLREDVVLVGQSVHEGMHDIILGEKNGNRRLLVRVLDGADASGTATAEHAGAETKVQGMAAPLTMTIYRLTIPTRAKVFGSKVLLYAFREGEDLPGGSWNPRTGLASILWPDQKDSLQFAKQASGRTQISVSRNGETIAGTP